METQPQESHRPQTLLPSSQNAPHEDIQTEGMFDCSCLNCNYGRIGKENMGRHETDENPTANWDLTCEICSQKYRCLVGLFQHMSSQHSSQIICPFCPFLAQDLAGFNAHMLGHSLTQSVPTGPYNYNTENVANFKAQTSKSTCQESPKEFENSNLTFDAATADETFSQRASTKNELRCGNCSTTFTSKWGLRRHDKNKCKSNNLDRESHKNSKDKPFKCNNFGCNYKGRRVHHLQSHQRLCRGRVPVPAAAESSDEISIVAVVDKRNEETPESLMEKAGILEGEPQYSGSSCNFRSQSSSRLKQHLKIHTGHKRFRCPKEDCKYQSNRFPNLRRHCKSVHYMDWPLETPLQAEENLGPVMEYQTETEVEMIQSGSSMAFACMLCSFIGDSELSALEHARQHTTVHIPLEPIY